MFMTGKSLSFHSITKCIQKYIISMCVPKSMTFILKVTMSTMFLYFFLSNYVCFIFFYFHILCQFQR